jgi:endonuclease YncB( thermonuclease family)
MIDHRAIIAIGLALAFLVVPALADAIAPGAVQVLDSDTIEARGETVRLVGVDTPESGINARRRSGAICGRPPRGRDFQRP